MGVLSYQDASGSLVLGEKCGNCETTGSVVCINCQGSGLTVPEDFLQLLGDEEVSLSLSHSVSYSVFCAATNQGSGAI